MIPQRRSARCAPDWRTARSAPTRSARPRGTSASRSIALRRGGMRPARSPRDTSIKAARSGWHSAKARALPSSEQAQSTSARRPLGSKRPKQSVIPIDKPLRLRDRDHLNSLAGWPDLRAQPVDAQEQGKTLARIAPVNRRSLLGLLRRQTNPPLRLALGCIPDEARVWRDLVL